MSLMGLDVGTTGCKAIAFNVEGKEIAKSYREYPLLHPFIGAAELDPITIWDSIRQVIQEVNAQVSSDPVQALAVSSQGETCTPVDVSGNPLHNFVVTFDNRTIEQEAWWATHMDARKLFSTTGMPLHAMYTLNKLMWFRQHKPEIYNKAWKFLCCEDYIIYKLTGIPALDYSMAARTMAFDIKARRWSDEIIRLADIDGDKFSPTFSSGTGVETIPSGLARKLGFSKKVIVATGGHDQPCGALGSGVIFSGTALNAIGTSDVLCPTLSQPVLTDAMLTSNFCCYPHVFKDYYCSIGFNLTGGLLLRWYRDTFCKEEIEISRRMGYDPYDIIFETISPEPRDLYFLPHFVGSGTPTLDSKSRGAILGLTLDVRKPELARAIIDSINYEMKLNIEAMEDAGVSISKLHVVGGGARNSKWLQMKADVFNKPIYVMEHLEAAAFGAALLAGQAAGIYKTIEKTVTSLIKIKHIFTPNLKSSNQYEPMYHKYRSIYPLLKQFNHDLI
jgi:xylulokinase